MTSVCMATKNGAKFLEAQIDSILIQLTPKDELIISDDCSTDNTVAIIETYNDSRIKLIRHDSPQGILKNFEASLRYSKGEYIFLADQDDIWVPTKISIMKDVMREHDLVISDCLMVDHSLQAQNESFFSINNSGKGFIKNIIKNSYMGCCMAFRRKLLKHVIPFPADIPIHDFWIGLIGELYFRVHFIPEVLVYHRRHTSNASSTGKTSAFSFQRKFANRYRMIKNLLLHTSYAA